MLSVKNARILICMRTKGCWHWCVIPYLFASPRANEILMRFIKFLHCMHTRYAVHRYSWHIAVFVFFIYKRKESKMKGISGARFDINVGSNAKRLDDEWRLSVHFYQARLIWVPSRTKEVLSRVNISGPGQPAPVCSLIRAFFVCLQEE